MSLRRGTLLLALLVVASGAEAHIPQANAVVRDSAGATFGVALPLLLSGALYLIGLSRLYAGRRAPRGIVSLRAVSFFAGLLTLAFALLSRLDEWSATSFAFHMTQHEILMLVAAPLLVLGRPLPMFLWALPSGMRAGTARVTRSIPVQGTWAVLMAPITAWLFHAIALWAWHAPALFDAALRSTAIHDLQHLTFLLSALVFWAALIEEREREHRGAAVLYLFTTTVHTGVLGALLTFASHPWYSAYADFVPQWPLSPLEDQQLGGLIMWIPASMVYVGVGLALLAQWIRKSDSGMPMQPDVASDPHEWHRDVPDTASPRVRAP
jgi:putative membrane protein